METKYLLGAAAIAAVAVLAGTFIVLGDSGAQGDDMDVRYLDGTGSATASVGDKVTIAMKGNATTGYDWKVAEMPDGIELVDDWYESGQSEKGLVGVGGYHYFTFKSDKAGTYEVVLDYLRSWEGSEGNTTTVEIVFQ